jgi:histidine ammonia-lyase
MGANAATKAYRVLENLERILAIELFNAAQALDFRRPAKSSPYIENFVSKFREKVKFIENDKVMYEDMRAAVWFLKEIDFGLPGEDVRAYKM